jgi:predicted transcriptional regulator
MSNILQIASDGASATKIVDKAGLSSAQMGTYVQRLAKCRLIETSHLKRKTLYRTTSKGKHFLRIFAKLRELVTTD